MNEENSLWMGDISPDFDESTIMKSFQYFNIYPLKIKFIKDKKTDINRNYCFVFFKNNEEANIALNHLNGKIIPNTNLIFKLNKASYHSRINRTLFVGNLNKSINDEMLFNFFHLKYNSVNKAIVIKENGISKGYGFVMLKKETEYKKCLIEMDGALIQGSRIIVREQKRKDEFEGDNNNNNNYSSNISNNIFIKNIINNTNSHNYNISEYNNANNINNINNDILINYITRNNNDVNNLQFVNNINLLDNNRLIFNDLNYHINNIFNVGVINNRMLTQNNNNIKISNFNNTKNIYNNNNFNIKVNNLEKNNIYSKKLNKENSLNNNKFLNYNKNINNNKNNNLNYNDNKNNYSIINNSNICNNTKINRYNNKLVKLEILEKLEEKALIKKIRDSINNTFYHYKKLYLSNEKDIKCK